MDEAAKYEAAHDKLCDEYDALEARLDRLKTAGRDSVDDEEYMQVHRAAFEKACQRSRLTCAEMRRRLCERRIEREATQIADVRFFYIIRINAKHFKTGIANDVDKRLRNYRCANPSAVVVDTWPCPYDVVQEQAAQNKMIRHSSCTHIGGENFNVHNEREFITELRRIFSERDVEGSES